MSIFIWIILSIVYCLALFKSENMIPLQILYLLFFVAYVAFHFIRYKHDVDKHRLATILFLSFGVILFWLLEILRQVVFR